MLILFDLDDTLMDHTAAMRLAASALHREAGLTEALEDFLLRWRTAQDRHYPRFLTRELTYEGQRRERVREAVDATLDDAAADQVFATYLAAYRTCWQLFPEVLPCLERLAGHRLGVISNGRGAEQRGKLDQLGITHHFEGVFISDDCPSAKPDARIFLHACETMGESPANAIYVGDRYDLDAEGARRAGLHGVWLDRERTAADHHLPPIICTLDELVPIVDQIAKSAR